MFTFYSILLFTLLFRHLEHNGDYFHIKYYKNVIVLSIKLEIYLHFSCVKLYLKRFRIFFFCEIFVNF